MPHRSVLIAIDIGATKIALMVFDARTHEPLATTRFKTNPTASAEGTIKRLKQHADALLEREGLARRRLRAVGAAVPGQIDLSGNVLTAMKLGWVDVPFRELLSKAFGAPASVEHDALAAAIGERWKGHAQRANDFVFLALGTGVGAGLFLGGRPHRGRHFAAGEIGNMLLRSQTFATPPHQRNLEKQVGSPYIRERAGVPAHVPAKAVLDHPDAARVAERVCGEVAAAVINICSVVDPELVVIGGGTATDALLTRVRYRVEEELMWRPELLRSALGEDAQLYGALWGALGVAQQREAA